MATRTRYPGDLEAARIRARAARRHRSRTRFVLSVMVLLAGTALLVSANLVYLHWRAQQPATVPAAAPAPEPSTPVPMPASPSTVASASAPPAVPANVPTKGKDTFTYAPANAQVIGAGTGAVKKYLVAVEDGSGQDLAGFADAVRRILSDPRGWTAGGAVRFQQVAKDGAPNFSVTLATQATAERTCAFGGIHTDQYTSCRLPGQLVINLTRWLSGIPDYGAPLAEYQAFELNHAVGQELGYPNQACPAPGQAAPVMQKQALGLKGCTANGWPYLNGSLYQGPVLP
jgi:uncharacterized protein DUF3152